MDNNTRLALLTVFILHKHGMADTTVDFLASTCSHPQSRDYQGIITDQQSILVFYLLPSEDLVQMVPQMSCA